MKRMLLIVLGVIIICCLIPQKFVYYDGGTIEYRAIAYTIIDYHTLPPTPALEPTTGKLIKIFGIKIYDSVKNRYSLDDIIKYDMDHDVIRCGYINEKNYNLIINSYEDFIKNIDKITNKDYLITKYTEEFFKDNNLVFIYFVQNSGSNELKYVGSDITDNTINIHYYIDYPEVGTMDMNGDLLLIKVSKNIDNIKLIKDK